MAPFQKGSPKSLIRNLGIVYGYIGADDYDSLPALTLAEGQKTILDMTREGVVSFEKGEEIYQTMEKAGVCPDIQAVANLILANTTPDSFYSRWQMDWEHCEACSGIHGRLTDKVSGIHTGEAGIDIDDFVSTLMICDEFFQDNMMSLEEAVLILKETIEKAPLETEKEADRHAPN